MIYIQMYSYKGGSGRTVSTANICSILAEKGYNVLVVDLDIESAGLNYVLRKDIKDQCVKVQDIINDSYIEVGSGRVKTGLKGDVFTRRLFDDDFNRILPKISENLFFIPARYSSLDAISWKTATNLNTYITRMNNLVNKVKGFRFDFVFFDSPSGLQSWARNIFEKCFLVIFFRWSRQFTLGTIEFIQNRFLPEPSENSWHIPPGALLVPNAVPSPDDTKRFGMERLQRNYAKMISAEIKAISLTIQEKNKNIKKNFIGFDEEGIPECPILKWDERILDPNKKNEELAYKAYLRIADRLIAMKKEEG